MHKYRTNKCGELSEQSLGKTVKLSGWLSRKRDHGNLLFIDLRDHYGTVQCVFESKFKDFKLVESIPNESVITLTGKVILRDQENINDNLVTGKIEIAAEEISVISYAKELPLPVSGCPTEYPEETRLKYRFLDLRREEIHKNIVLRSEVISYIRKTMIEKYGFKEDKTPILTSSSPEGARDFLVPSRLNPGKFYALPQAPQQFKQLIMLSGFDRYFQIAPCFRDEDARADRSPGEFYQLDIEMSFVTQEDVLELNEQLMRDIFTKFSNKKINEGPFPLISYRDSIEKYGTDKPDLRNPLIIQDLSEVFINSGFKIFDDAVKNGSVVKAIKLQCKDKPRSFFDKLNSWARSEGMPGLGYLVFTDNETQGPIGKNLNNESIEKIRELSSIEPNDALFFVCNSKEVAQNFAGKIRTKLGQDLINKDEFKFCWIVDMPMYEWNEKEEKIDFSHNPFSMPQGGLEALKTKDPLDILAYQYDIVCNGVELSSGAIRNHDQEIMIKAFEIAGYNKSDIEEKFSCLFNAFAYGSPPHGGIAPGIDRIVMLLAGTENIREVIMFPMNQKGQDLLMSAPSVVSDKQLKELKIKLDKAGNKIN